MLELDPKYMVKVRLTVYSGHLYSYGTLDWVREDNIQNFHHNVTNVTRTFKYQEVVHNHSQLRDYVDANNSDRIDPISLEDFWKTTRGATRVFTFFFSISKVNYRLALVKLYRQTERS